MEKEHQVRSQVLDNKPLTYISDFLYSTGDPLCNDSCSQTMGQSMGQVAGKPCLPRVPRKACYPWVNFL
jgi:hypothetical protein